MIVALGPRGEAAAMLQGLVPRFRISIVVMDLDGGQGLDRRPVILEAVAVVIELGRGPLPGLAVIVALGPRGEAAVALQGARAVLRISIVVMELDGGQVLDRLPVILEAVAG